MAKLPLISVVEDDISVRESLQSLVRSARFAVMVFASAEEFLDSDHLSKTDCLIVDVRMSGMNGLELQRQLVASHYETPVIVITAHASNNELREQALRNGAVDYLVKPFSEEAVLNAIHAALNFKISGTKKGE